jgi:iron complex outermembrane receptor protein
VGNITSLKFVKKLNILALSMVLFGPSLATAQDEALEETLVNSSETEDQSLVSDAVDEIIVTGSRLKRDTYSSVSPMQIITAEMSREVGLINPGDILQTSTASSGQQIDLTFSGFVLDNGPGSSTANLRGLGEARTLV